MQETLGKANASKDVVTLHSSLRCFDIIPEYVIAYILSFCLYKEQSRLCRTCNEFHKGAKLNLGKNHGKYDFIVSDPLELQRMYACKNERIFREDLFEIGVLKWKIAVYPNGDRKNAPGSFNLYVRLLSMPASWKSVVVQRIVSSPQVKTKYSAICDYKPSYSWGWPNYVLTLDELIRAKLDYVCIRVEMNVIKINLLKDNRVIYQQPCFHPTHQYIEWKVPKETLGIMKNAYPGKQFESPTIDDKWVMSCCPNGSTKEKEGDVLCSLNLLTMESDMDELKIKYLLRVNEANVGSGANLWFHYNGPNWNWAWDRNTLSFKEFCKLETVTISASIIIEGKKDMDGRKVPKSKWVEKGEV